METPTTNQSLKPWEQQPGESAKRYAAFSLYCQLGVNRSLEKAWQLYLQVRKPKKYQECINTGSKFIISGFFRNWCVEGFWVSRCRDYDNDTLKNSFNLGNKEIQQGIIKHHKHRTKDADLIRKANRKALLVSYSRLKKVEDIEKSLPNLLDNFDPQEVAKILRAYDLESLVKMVKNSSEGLSAGNEEESKTLLIDKLINIYQLTLEHPNDIKENNVIDFSNVSKTA